MRRLMIDRDGSVTRSMVSVIGKNNDEKSDNHTLDIRIQTFVAAPRKYFASGSATRDFLGIGSYPYGFLSGWRGFRCIPW